MLVLAALFVGVYVLSSALALNICQVVPYS